MNTEQLDFFFPFIVFLYGFLVVFVLEIPVLSRPRTAQGQMLLQHLEPKRKFAWICLCVGAAWSLQNLVLA